LVVRQFFGFAVVGVGGLLVDLGVLYAGLLLFGLGYLTARLLSFLAAASFTWYLNRRITFAGCDRRAPVRQFLRFLGVNSFGGAVNYGVYVLVMYGYASEPWRPFLGVALGSLSGLLFNFLGSRRLVFGAHRQGGADLCPLGVGPEASLLPARPGTPCSEAD
jgi:putative flippase GtrA